MPNTSINEQTPQELPIENPITVHLVHDDDRIDFFLKYFSDINLCLKLENMIFNVARHFCEAYNGGYWDYYELSNGGFFIALSENKTFDVVNSMNYSSETLNGIDFGIFCTVISLSWLYEERTAEPYHRLVEYYVTLPSDRLHALIRLLD